MSADDRISSITIDNPIAMVAVFGWPVSIFVPVLAVDVFIVLIDESFVVESNDNVENVTYHQ
jgi:Mn2+/Fe2+ NRAMP family transporter